MSHNVISDLTAEFVRETFHYDPNTGLLTWKKRLAKRMPVGKVAGTPDACGYIQIRINFKSYKAARLIWLYMTGSWPTLFIDHINRNRADNRWENLREGTLSQNQWNRGKQRRNKSGYKGVHFDRGSKKWCAAICAHNQNKFLGLFDSPEKAHAAYCAAAKKLHGKFARSA